ncbi:peptidoglycan-binding protein [Rhodophyticola sp. CCM32]|uniref:serine protease n=1 Tax=Rhodophyticola sp. CCM32 TaxID=2916397 RepID=UPI00107F747F|nr:serine protease [Rhodophyticola sp. CCM32]QBY00935.1 peptidoglycan-binding protein [Rhodophyticola sp. CCM32]
MTRGFTQVCLAIGIALCAAVFSAQTAHAQDRVWIQIEAHPDLATAESRVRAYSRLIDNVNGYRLASGWYAVALGPFTPGNANQQLTNLRAQGLIPRDSYVELGTIYRQQFWPVGANTLTAQPVAPALPETSDPVSTATATVETIEPAAPVAPPEETAAQARQSERALDRPAREALQIALQWFGFYQSGIDGAFGPGTRRAMSDWQTAQGLEPTGILTTRQRTQLLDTYTGELAALGMGPIRDMRAGIEINLPLAMVRFDRYEYPFVHYTSRAESGVQVLLISQTGDRATLHGLYEIMQTLEIVPLEGERTRGDDSFLLTGQSASLRSHTVARLENGQVKGFTLIWTPDRDAQMARVLPMMEQSLTFLDETLDPGATDPGSEQGIDLISGLEVRRPDISRSGFYVDDQGAVLTTTQVVGQCTRLMIDDVYEADLTYRNDDLGLAVLRPQNRLAPLAHAAFASRPPRLRADIAVAGFPFDGALSTASLTFGTLADLTGLNGEQNIQRLDITSEDSDAGGPVLDTSGAVLGMMLPEAAEGRALPDGVSFALRGDQLTTVLAEAGVTPAIATGGRTLGREALARLGADMTVLVSCWN